MKPKIWSGRPIRQKKLSDLEFCCASSTSEYCSASRSGAYIDFRAQTPVAFNLPHRRDSALRPARLVMRIPIARPCFSWLQNTDTQRGCLQRLPPPDVIGAEVVENLEAALEEFRAVADELGAGEQSIGDPAVSPYHDCDRWSLGARYELVARCFLRHIRMVTKRQAFIPVLLMAMVVLSVVTRADAAPDTSGMLSAPTVVVMQDCDNCAMSETGSAGMICAASCLASACHFCPVSSSPVQALSQPRASTVLHELRPILQYPELHPPRTFFQS